MVIRKIPGQDREQKRCNPDNICLVSDVYIETSGRKLSVARDINICSNHVLTKGNSGLYGMIHIVWDHNSWYADSHQPKLLRTHNKGDKLATEKQMVAMVEHLGLTTFPLLPPATMADAKVAIEVYRRDTAAELQRQHQAELERLDVTCQEMRDRVRMGEAGTLTLKEQQLMQVEQWLRTMNVRWRLDSDAAAPPEAVYSDLKDLLGSI